MLMASRRKPHSLMLPRHPVEKWDTAGSACVWAAFAHAHAKSVILMACGCAGLARTSLCCGWLASQPPPSGAVFVCRKSLMRLSPATNQWLSP